MAGFRTIATALMLIACLCSSSEALPERAYPTVWLIAVSHPWVAPGRVVVLASPDAITEAPQSIRRATLTFVYESIPGGARSTVAVVETDCVRNSQNILTMDNYREDGSPLPASRDANPSNGFSPNAPNAIGTRINRALCADPQDWGNAIPAQEVPRDQTAVRYAIAIFSSRYIAQAALTTVAGPPPAQAESLAAPRNGQMACYRVNQETMRCQTIERYEFRSADTVVVNATVAQDTLRRSAMRVSYLARIRDNAICGGPDENDVRAATLWIDGLQADATLTRQFREQFSQRLPLIAAQGEQCVRFSQLPYGIWAQVTLAGTYNPVLDAPVLWVSTDSGYEVRP